MSCDTPKNHDFFIFHSYTSKKWKNHEFSRCAIFPILSSPRSDFHQNFAFSHAPAGKISHKSDINIPFLDWGIIYPSNRQYRCWSACRMFGSGLAKNPNSEKKLIFSWKKWSMKQKIQFFHVFRGIEVRKSFKKSLNPKP